MELLTNINAEKILADKKAIELIDKLKNLVYQYDKNAEIILFGSRARGDWHEESDWDFLILTVIEVSENFKQELRVSIANKIEFILNESIFIIVKNKIDWEENNNVTPLFYNICEEGIKV